MKTLLTILFTTLALALTARAATIANVTNYVAITTPSNALSLTVYATDGTPNYFRITLSNLLRNVVPPTNTLRLVLGGGGGNTQYVATVFSNSINSLISGSSNIHIASVSGGAFGAEWPFRWAFTNLSGIVWGFGVSAGTNRWHWSGPGGITNMPIGISNDCKLVLWGVINGTNIDVNWHTNKPAL